MGDNGVVEGCVRGVNDELIAAWRDLGLELLAADPGLLRDALAFARSMASHLRDSAKDSGKP